MRVVMLTGSFGDGRCGVGDYTARLASRLGQHVELTVIAARGHTALSSGASEPEFVPQDSLPADNSSISFLLPEPESTDPEGVLDWYEAHRDLLEDSQEHNDETGGSVGLEPTENYSLARLGRLSKQVLALEPDLVHIQYPSRGYARRLGVNLIPLWLQARVPLVATLHESSAAHPLRKVSEVFLVKETARLIVPAERERRAVEQFYGRREGVEVLPVGCTPAPCENETPGQHSMESEGGELAKILDREGRISGSVFHYGFPTAEKGLTDLIEAASGLSEQREVRLFLGLGGRENHPAARRALDRAEHLGMSSRVHLLGRLNRAELFRVAARMQVVAFPFTDGFSTRRSSLFTLLDAGVPVVTTRGDRKLPLVAAEPGDSKDLRDALESVLALYSTPPGKSRLQRLLDLQSGLCRFYSYGRLARVHASIYNALL